MRALIAVVILAGLGAVLFVAGSEGQKALAQRGDERSATATPGYADGDGQGAADSRHTPSPATSPPTSPTISPATVPPGTPEPGTTPPPGGRPTASPPPPTLSPPGEFPPLGERYIVMGFNDPPPWIPAVLLPGADHEFELRTFLYGPVTPPAPVPGGRGTMPVTGRVIVVGAMPAPFRLTEARSSDWACEVAGANFQCIRTVTLSDPATDIGRITLRATVDQTSCAYTRVFATAYPGAAWAQSGPWRINCPELQIWGRSTPGPTWDAPVSLHDITVRNSGLGPTVGTLFVSIGPLSPNHTTIVGINGFTCAPPTESTWRRLVICQREAPLGPGEQVVVTAPWNDFGPTCNLVRHWIQANDRSPVGYAESYIGSNLPCPVLALELVPERSSVREGETATVEARITNLGPGPTPPGALSITLSAIQETAQPALLEAPAGWSCTIDFLVWGRCRSYGTSIPEGGSVSAIRIRVPLGACSSWLSILFNAQLYAPVNDGRAILASTSVAQDCASVTGRWETVGVELPHTYRLFVRGGHLDLGPGKADALIYTTVPARFTAAAGVQCFAIANAARCVLQGPLPAGAEVELALVEPERCAYLGPVAILSPNWIGSAGTNGEQDCPFGLPAP